MSLKNEIFLQLIAAKGRSVSGESLAKKLNVSRAAVWKAIKTLKEEGCDIEAATNRGYLLRSVGDKIDEENLSAELGVKVIHLDSVSSTNAYARSLEEKEATLIVADVQTSGKARRRKEFPSPKNKGLYMSYLFFPDGEKAAPSLLTSAAARIVAEAVGGEAKEHEVYRGGEKIAGVLAETIADPDGAEFAVIGIGIYTEGLSKGRRELIAEIANRLKEI